MYIIPDQDRTVHAELAQDDLLQVNHTKMVLSISDHTRTVHMRQAQDSGHHTTLRQVSAHHTRQAQGGANMPDQKRMVHNIVDKL